jgi:hypothetical protein
MGENSPLQGIAKASEEAEQTQAQFA